MCDPCNAVTLRIARRKTIVMTKKDPSEITTAPRLGLYWDQKRKDRTSEPLKRPRKGIPISKARTKGMKDTVHLGPGGKVY